MQSNATLRAISKLSVTAAVDETYRLVKAQQRAGKRVGLVPTMGALHAGHLSLVERCRRECDYTVVSIFVNPKQFAPHEDFSKYPRSLEDDLAKLAPLGVDMVFAPTVEDMYPAGFDSYVDAGNLAVPWEGEFRPGHFRGVLTVVLKLFQIVPADLAYFGRKDYQQSLLVRRMVADLNLPMKIVVCPIVRDSDGLALSSRNVFLIAEQRRQALSLSRGLQLAHQRFGDGERSGVKLRELIRQTIAGEPGVEIEYAAVVDPETLVELPRIEKTAVALVAARVGSTRLIDNELLGKDE
jgi:pantoate--beta-alanine ligase